MRRSLICAALVCMVSFVASLPVYGQAASGSAPPVAPSADATKKPAPGLSNASAALNILDAETLYRAGKLNQAAQAYASLIASGPDPALAYDGLARVYLRQGKVAEASAAATKGFALAPTYPATKVSMGEVYFRQGKIAEAEHEFIGLINTGVPSARAYLGEARISRALSLYKQSKTMIDKAYALDPADPDIQRFWLGTLSGTERIKALQGYLSDESSQEAEDRHELTNELARLQDDSGQSRSCRLVSKISSTETDLKQLLYDPQHIRGYGLDVKLNGVGATLLVDTGAGGILIDRKFAEKAGVKKISDTQIRGLGDSGDTGGYVGHVDSVKIGDVEFQDCYVDVVDKKSAIDESGLIGADVLSHFLIDLDFPDSKLKLSELPHRPDETSTNAAPESRPAGSIEFHDRYIAPEMKSYSQVFRFGHMLLIPTVVSKTRPKLFLIDTGAFNNQMSPAAARDVTKVWGDSDTTVKGLNGKVKDVFRANDVTLIFAHLRQQNQDIISFDMTSISDSAGTEVSGILGFAMLRMLDIKIDYRDGLVDLTFDSKRWPTNPRF
jgi:predicted aspartyl protease